MSNLSDEQIERIWDKACAQWAKQDATPMRMVFARAIESAVREKGHPTTTKLLAEAAVREKGASPAPADERARFEQYFSAAWLMRDGDTYKDVHADLWEGWQARAALAPSPAGERETPIAEIDEFWGIRYCGAEPIAAIVKRHGLKAGTKLYVHPAAQPAAPAGEREPADCPACGSTKVFTSTRIDCKDCGGEFYSELVRHYPHSDVHPADTPSAVEHPPLNTGDAARPLPRPPFTADELRRCAARCGHRPSAATLYLLVDFLEELAAAEGSAKRAASEGQQVNDGAEAYGPDEQGCLACVTCGQPIETKGAAQPAAPSSSPTPSDLA
jgi:hypothetical protein